MLRRSNRRGVSIMVGYVLLIAIAVSLSAGVYYFMKLYLPDQAPTCSPDVKLSITQASCTHTPLDVKVTVANKGLFSVHSLLVSMGQADRVYRANLNEPNARFSVYPCTGQSALGATDALDPGQTYCFNFPNSPQLTSALVGITLTEPQEIVVEPLMWIDNKPTLCSDSIATTVITCT
jgi:FlaG/FlaF family flagellin (archaellin)